LPSGWEPFVSGHLPLFLHFAGMDVAMCLRTANPPSISRQTKIHNIGATLVGLDKFGNKYYEKLQDTQHGEQYSIVLVDLLQLLLMWNSSVVPLEFRS